jgi:hypothetical protein
LRRLSSVGWLYVLSRSSSIFIWWIWWRACSIDEERSIWKRTFFFLENILFNLLVNFANLECVVREFLVVDHKVYHQLKDRIIWIKKREFSLPSVSNSIGFSSSFWHNLSSINLNWLISSDFFFKTWFVFSSRTFACFNCSNNDNSSFSIFYFYKKKKKYYFSEISKSINLTWIL